MMTVFDKTTRDELIRRINMLDETSPAQWGKMNTYQMLKHCRQYEEMMLGKKQYKRAFLGLLFGKMALKDFIQDETPIKRNVPTVTQLKIKEDKGDITSERSKWIALIEEYADSSDANIVHPFFGSMTKNQVGQLAFKHTDHHLRQFNC